MAAREKYTHGHHESVLRSHTWRTIANSAAYLAPHLLPGQRVLDVGCGPGTITAEIADRVGPDGSVLGHRRVGGRRRAGVRDAGASEPHVQRRRRVLRSTPTDDSFDVVHAHQVLQHLGDPVAALREMRRVCRPGGLVAARDSDYTGMAWYPRVPELSEWLELYCVITRGNGGDPDAGRRLLAYAHAAGFDDVTPSAGVWCFATPVDREWWAEPVGRPRRRVVPRRAGDRRWPCPAPRTSNRIAAAWRTWASDPDAWFAVLHGEILARA